MQALPPQWVNADLRELDVSVLGKYDVVVADPPWAIHQEVRFPRSSLSPESIRKLTHPTLTVTLRDAHRCRNDANASW